jgi:hypothetical protein
VLIDDEEGIEVELRRLIIRAGGGSHILLRTKAGPRSLGRRVLSSRSSTMTSR